MMRHIMRGKHCRLNERERPFLGAWGRFLVGGLTAMAMAASVSATDPAPTAAAESAGDAPAWTREEMERGYVVFEHTTLENLTPTTVPARGVIVARVACAMARGQRASIQLGVHALAELEGVRIDVDADLPVTVYHRIDPGVREQLAETDMSWLRWTPPELYLQPGQTVLEVPAGTSVNFWLTFHAAPDVRPGTHRGEVRIRPAGRAATTLSLDLEVRPFELAAARIPFGMYYREDMLLKRFGGWDVGEELELELYRDMAAHSQNSVHFYMAGDFAELPPKAFPGTVPLTRRVALAIEAGLVHSDIPCVIAQHTIGVERLSPAQLAAAADWLGARHINHGWPEILAYGWDEPPYPAPGLRERYVPLRTVPVRLTTAMGPEAAYAYGDVFDAWILIGGGATPAMRAEAQRRGAQVWTYSYRILREGFKPLRQRYYAGLYTWAHELGGNYVWAYSHGHHGHVWWKPGTTGPLPITGWEARRDGVDDYRYLQMVEDAVAASPGSVGAVEAAAWLESLRARLLGFDPHQAEPGAPLGIGGYEEVRATAAGYIQRLGAAAVSAVPRPPQRGLRDEAAPYRNASMDACIQGLGSERPTDRRAAAWALFEMGPDGAPAVPALGNALVDPEVRIPALRALEAIGPQACAVAPLVTALLAHPDSYMRLGATFALTNMARPPSWNEDLKGYLPGDRSAAAPTLVAPLRQALRDRNRAVVELAAHGLYLCGAAAAAALPDAVQLVGLGEEGSRHHRESGLRVLSGLGPGAEGCVAELVRVYGESEGKEYLVARALAAIGPQAASAVPVLEQHRTSESRFLADVCYALFCIRGGEAEIATLADLVGDAARPNGYSEWRDAARFLGAIGGEAAPVASVLRERLARLGSEPALQRHIEEVVLPRIEGGAPPLRLLPR